MNPPHESPCSKKKKIEKQASVSEYRGKKRERKGRPDGISSRRNQEVAHTPKGKVATWYRRPIELMKNTGSILVFLKQWTWSRVDAGCKPQIPFQEGIGAIWGEKKKGRDGLKRPYVFSSKRPWEGPKKKLWEHPQVRTVTKGVNPGPTKVGRKKAGPPAEKKGRKKSKGKRWFLRGQEEKGKKNPGNELRRGERPKPSSSKWGKRGRRENQKRQNGPQVVGRRGCAQRRPPQEGSVFPRKPSRMEGKPAVTAWGVNGWSLCPRGCVDLPQQKEKNEEKEEGEHTGTPGGQNKKRVPPGEKGWKRRLSSGAGQGHPWGRRGRAKKGKKRPELNGTVGVVPSAPRGPPSE